MGSVVDAWSGFMGMRGYPDLDVVETLATTHMDATTGPSAVIAILGALRLREQTGQGQFIDFSQAENMLQAVGEYFLDYQWNQRQPEPLGNRDRWHAVQGCYRCAGPDSWVALTVRTEDEWRAFATVLGQPGWLADPRLATPAGRWEHHDELDAAISAWTAGRDAMDVMRALQDHGVAAGKVMTESDLFADPHVRARDFFVELTLPEAGTHLYPGHQWHPQGTPLRLDRPAPTLGQHNQYVYRELLGYSAAEYERLVREDHIGEDFLPGTPPVLP
jgi:crotonobetainyl-CoA:carnitine CoA-transferase CaiB-like acyl-CoA transferase